MDISKIPKATGSNSEANKTTRSQEVVSTNDEVFKNKNHTRNIFQTLWNENPKEKTNGGTLKLTKVARQTIIPATIKNLFCKARAPKYRSSILIKGKKSESRPIR